MPSEGNGDYIFEPASHAKLNSCSFICNPLLYATMSSENGSGTDIIYKDIGYYPSNGQVSKKAENVLSSEVGQKRESDNSCVSSVVCLFVCLF